MQVFGVKRRGEDFLEGFRVGWRQREGELGAGVRQDDFLQLAGELRDVLMSHGQRRAVLAALRQHLFPGDRGGGEVLNLVNPDAERMPVVGAEGGSLSERLPGSSEDETPGQLGRLHTKQTLRQMNQQPLIPLNHPA